MKVSIVGAGNVATRLGLGLREAGGEVVGVWSRRAAAARTLAAALDVPAAADIADLPQADVCLLAVKDDAVRSVAERVAAAQPGAILAHTAGSVPLSVFDGLGRDCGVIYPLQTFSKARPVALRDVPFFLEASSEMALHTLRKLAGKLSGSVTLLDSAQRARLHLAAVFANNFANHCFALAADLLRAEGLDETLLHPLIRETADKALSLPAREAQTGPAVRFDAAVLERQAAILANRPTLQQIYRLMSSSIHELAAHDSSE